MRTLIPGLFLLTLLAVGTCQYTPKDYTYAIGTGVEDPVIKTLQGTVPPSMEGIQIPLNINNNRATYIKVTVNAFSAPAVEYYPDSATVTINYAPGQIPPYGSKYNIEVRGY